VERYSNGRALSSGPCNIDLQPTATGEIIRAAAAEGAGFSKEAVCLCSVQLRAAA